MTETTLGQWVLHTKPEKIMAGQKSFEICVIRVRNEHGFKSYGWFDENKLLISHNGGPCSWPLTQKVLDKLLCLAADVAEELNLEEANAGI